SRPSRPATAVRKPGGKCCLHPQGRNAVEDGKAVAGGASLAGPKAGAGRGGRNRRGGSDGGRRG
ncbi:hypothetical protein ACCT00_24830, partial [Rhizobium ruizarguesonis]